MNYENMTIHGELISQLYKSFSNISHPLEGTFYLFLLAVFFRWIWPLTWNNFLRRISASIQKDEGPKG